MLATGNVGSYQQLRADDVGTYFSRDGGVSWELIKKGQHVYAFGDHGAIMLMASDQQATTEYMYGYPLTLSLSLSLTVLVDWRTASPGMRA